MNPLLSLEGVGKSYLRGPHRLRVLKDVTLDLGAGGFAVLLASPPRAGEMADFRLDLERNSVVEARARVVSLQRKGKPYRVAFRFEELTAEDKERIGLAIFDAAISRIIPQGP